MWYLHCRDKDYAALKSTTLADDTLPASFKREKKEDSCKALVTSKTTRPLNILVNMDVTELVTPQHKPSLLDQLVVNDSTSQPYHKKNVNAVPI